MFSIKTIKNTSKMKNSIKFFSLIMLGLLLFSCNSETEDFSNEENFQDDAIQQESIEKQGLHVVLGKQKEIAYSVKNMQRTVNYINKNIASSKYMGRLIKPTHYYIKFIPNNEEHLKILNEIDKEGKIVLSSYPLDYEIVQQGSFLEQDDAEAVKYAAMYTTVSKNFVFPDVPYEILEDVYQPKENENDLEIAALVLNGDEKDLGIKFESKRLGQDNLVKFLNEFDKGNKWGWWYTPHGYFKVYDTDKSYYVGVMSTKISIGRGIWWRYVYTNSSGHFTAPKKYIGGVFIRAKWRSSSATIRKHWNEIIGIGVSDALMYIKKSTNGKTYNTQLSDNHKWYKATVQNSIIKYNNHMQPKGVAGIYGANIWVTEGSGTMAATVMMNRYTWSTTYGAILAGWLPWLSPISFPITTVLNALVSHLYPDIVYTLSSKNTKRVDQIVFHESGHFSHALKAGSFYWGVLVNRELTNILNCSSNPYCDGNDPSYSAGRQIALAEGWATFTEHAVMKGYYSTDIWGHPITPFMENFMMRTVPSNINNENNGWFLSGLIWDVIDNHSETDWKSRLVNGQSGAFIRSIQDNLTLGNINSDYSSVYNRLTGGVYSGYSLKYALRNTFPSSKIKINQLFYSYGY